VEGEKGGSVSCLYGHKAAHEVLGILPGICLVRVCVCFESVRWCALVLIWRA
jgi:hypothetical protein